MPLEVLGDRYELRARIGVGGMATVWRGFDRRLGREVAVKILSDSLAADERFRLRFDREARHIASLSHPNIVVVYDSGADGDRLFHDSGLEGHRLFMVMELVRGQSLRQLMSRSQPLSSAFTLDLAADTLAGLAHAHSAGIIHRDIKPGNILVTESGQAKLADFGIAKGTAETIDLTDSGAVLGTVTYSAPEQLTGESLGPASDLYSVACVLYECVTGRPPFVADNIAALVALHQHAAPESVTQLAPDIPSELASAIERALLKDPADRFGSVNEMMDALGLSHAEKKYRRPLEASRLSEARTEEQEERVDPAIRRSWQRRVAPVAAAGLAIAIVIPILLLAPGGATGTGHHLAASLFRGGTTTIATPATSAPSTSVTTSSVVPAIIKSNGGTSVPPVASSTPSASSIPVVPTTGSPPTSTATTTVTSVTTSTAPPPPRQPSINGVSPIAATQTQTITISGTGFGTEPAFDGNRPCIQVLDGSWWGAGHVDVQGQAQGSGGACADAANGQGDLITVNVTSWSDTQITISGFTGYYGDQQYTHWYLASGDSVTFQVWNAQLGTGPAQWSTRVS